MKTLDFFERFVDCIYIRVDLGILAYFNCIHSHSWGHGDVETVL